MWLICGVSDQINMFMINQKNIARTMLNITCYGYTMILAIIPKIYNYNEFKISLHPNTNSNKTNTKIVQH